MDQKPKSQLFIGIVIGLFVSALLFSGALLFYQYNPFRQSDDRGNSISERGTKMPGTVKPGEITKVTYSTWRHAGLLYSGDGYVESDQIDFSRDGQAALTTSTDFDDGSDKDKSSSQRGSITPEQFEKLAQSITKNNFFNESDSTERISEGDAVLTVAYASGKKQVKTSNIDQDTPAIKAILQTLTDLQGQVEWSAQK